MILKEHLIEKGLAEALVFDSAKVSQDLVKTYNDCIVQGRMKIQQACQALSNATGRDKARSKKAGPVIKKLDDIIRALGDKAITSALVA